MKCLCLKWLMFFSLVLVSSKEPKAQSFLQIGDNTHDEIFVNLNYSMFNGEPAGLEYIHPGNRGIDISAIVRLGKKKRRTGFAIGLGISNVGFQTNVASWQLNDAEADFESYYPDPENTFVKNKLSLTYLELPMEIRFRARPDSVSSFYIAIGGKAGVMLDSHTKVKFEDGQKVKNKFNDVFYNFRYGPYVRIGAGNFGLYGFYSLSPLYEADLGMRVFSLGLVISGF